MRETLRELQTVGMSTFVKYYEVFKAYKNCTEIETITTHFTGEGWKKSSAETKANSAKRLFNNNQQLAALDFVRNANPNRVNYKWIEKAERLYELEAIKTENKEVEKLFVPTKYDLTKYRVKPRKGITESYTQEVVYSKFRNRLNSQSRIMAGINRCYLPRVFNLLDVAFKTTLSTQIEKVISYTLTHGRYEKIAIRELKRVFISDGKVLAQTLNNHEIELYFRYFDEYHPFQNYIINFDDVTLGHVKPMAKILRDNKCNLTQIGKITPIALQYIGKRGKTKLIVEASLPLVDKEALRGEIALIEAEVELELQPRKINSAINDN